MARFSTNSKIFKLHGDVKIVLLSISLRAESIKVKSLTFIYIIFA